MINIAIVGSGISGLATADVLSDKGYKVTILAADFPPNTTSNKAAAFWFPYHVRNDRRGIKWCNVSYHKYRSLTDIPASGVSMHRLLKLIGERFTRPDLSWIEHMPEGSYRSLAPSELLQGYALGFEAEVPLIETQIFLPWMIDRLKRKGICSVQQQVDSLEQLLDRYDRVVNCAGLGARALCDDESIYPVRGQVALLAPQPGRPIFLDNEQSMYLVPRKDATIVGGTYEEQVYEATTHPETIARLSRQAVALFPELEYFQVIGSWAGLRPFRREVRLEREDDINIIHNYGHAGSGFTLAWGCAEEVSTLIN